MNDSNNIMNAGLENYKERFLVDKFKNLEKEISEERGSFNLFALIIRQELKNKIDVVISAKWLNPHDVDNFHHLVNRINNTIGNENITRISRIILLKPSEPFVKIMNQTFHVEHGELKLIQDNFLNISKEKILYNIFIDNAILITSKRDN